MKLLRRFAPLLLRITVVTLVLLLTIQDVG